VLPFTNTTSACFETPAEGEPQLQFAHTFSRPNCFGTAPNPAPSQPFIGPVPHPLPAHDVFCQLTSLLQPYSLTEEWSIRQITPFVYFVRLQNNIGSRGSTSCIWNNSKLELLLPNLPHEQRVIAVNYHSQGRNNANVSSSMKSYQFLRRKIERGLYLLDQTGLPDWQGRLCTERLSSWSEEGNLLNMPSVEHLQDELDPVAERQERASNPEGFHTDGADHGPAPMQIGERPNESFEGILGGTMDLPSVQTSITDAEQRLEHKFQSLYNTAAPLSEAPVPETAPGAPTIFPVSVTGDIATVRKSDLDGLGNFVNMRKTPNAWHLEFPTLFPPILNDGIWSFFGQPNSNCINRDRSIKNYPAWHKWNMW
jgi:hypothetical protein